MDIVSNEIAKTVRNKIDWFYGKLESWHKNMSKIFEESKELSNEDIPTEVWDLLESESQEKHESNCKEVTEKKRSNSFNGAAAEGTLDGVSPLMRYILEYHLFGLICDLYSKKLQNDPSAAGDELDLIFRILWPIFVTIGVLERKGIVAGYSRELSFQQLNLETLFTNMPNDVANLLGNVRDTKLRYLHPDTKKTSAETYRKQFRAGWKRQLENKTFATAIGELKKMGSIPIEDFCEKVGIKIENIPEYVRAFNLSYKNTRYKIALVDVNNGEKKVKSITLLL